VKLSITSGALEDLEAAWSTTNPKVLFKIIRLIAEAARTPRTGTGKPERLKHLGGEVWSRRITEKDRLVYDIQSDVITIIACRFHCDTTDPDLASHPTARTGCSAAGHAQVSGDRRTSVFGVPRELGARHGSDGWPPTADGVLHAYVPGCLRHPEVG
jgi:toxin YoeB